jgi:hypothetical protein
MAPESSNVRDDHHKIASRRVLGVLATVALVAGVVWKFIWPWTGWRTDMIFLCVTVIGLVAGAVVANSR